LLLQKRKSSSKSKKVQAIQGIDGTRIPANIDTLLCEICAAGHCEDKIILCDRCDKGFHLFCLSPPLDDVPEGDWICPLCNTRDSDNLFFKTGNTMTFKEMREWNDGFAKAWFGDRIQQVCASLLQR
jgi:[histone H3]-trimethyl-L-lysine4 demethylase